MRCMKWINRAILRGSSFSTKRRQKGDKGDKNALVGSQGVLVTDDRAFGMLDVPVGVIVVFVVVIVLVY